MSTTPQLNQDLKPVKALDPIWEHIRVEATEVMDSDDMLGAFIRANILNHRTLEAAVIHTISHRLADPHLGYDLIRQAFEQMAADNQDWARALRVDIQAVFDRDPACSRYLQPLLYFKGFHALQTHRLAHWLWNRERMDFALFLQSRSSATFQTDIHPAVRMGIGIFLDHATGLVVGETTTIGDNVSILQNVTLGGTGKETGDRHPKIQSGVLIGAGATILGNIEIGHCSLVAAGSVVLKPVPANSTAAGVPAQIVGKAGCAEPSRAMDQLLHGNGHEGQE